MASVGNEKNGAVKITRSRNAFGLKGQARKRCDLEQQYVTNRNKITSAWSVAFAVCAVTRNTTSVVSSKNFKIMADLAHAGVPMKPLATFSKEDEEFRVGVLFASLKAMLTL